MCILSYHNEHGEYGAGHVTWSSPKLTPDELVP
jgi:hypothetical protein